MSDFLGGKFDNQEIKQRILEFKYTSGFKPTEKLIGNILDQFWFHDYYNSFLSDEIYLQQLLNFLDKNKPQRFNRYNFYEYFFDQIEKDDKGRYALQQIAIEFERLQTDALSPLGYFLLLRRIHVPARKFDIPWMENYHLGKIKERDGRRLFIWEHHTLTEFLVAEYLLKRNNTIEDFEKLAVLNQEGIIALKPSWSGVLRFLLESKKQSQIISWLLKFIEKNPGNLDDGISEILSFIDIYALQQAGKKIFEIIYSSYFDRTVWLPVWTRSRIAKFVNKESYGRLKRDIKEWTNVTETFVRRGNAVSILEGLLEDESQLLTPKERGFWKKILIGFANNPQDNGNGVLQRHSLAALAYFNDDRIIPLVANKCFEDTQDSLVRDEFIQFCVNSAPNSEITIDYLIKGVKRGSNIYARHGLYKITSKKSMEYFLSKISVDEEFLNSFLDHESIFDKDGADRELIKKIGKEANPQIIKSLKKLIFTVLRIKNYYKEEQSSFLRNVIKIISDYDPLYIFEMLDDVKREKDENTIDRLFYDLKELLALLLTKANIRRYFKMLHNFPERTRRDAQRPVYIAKRVNGDVGDQAYGMAVKLGFIENTNDLPLTESPVDFQKQRKQSVYKSFKEQLEPEPGKYNPHVFEYFIQSKKDIEEQWNAEDRKRLYKLAVEDCLARIDPRQFRVKIESRHEGNSRFTWSAQAAYFGDVIKVVGELAPEKLTQYRQKIIDFIPYDYDTGSILDFIRELKDSDLEWVNRIMSDKKDDRRYLITQTYIYLVGEYAKRGSKLPSVKPILKSFVTDSEIQDYYRRSALEKLEYFIDKSDVKTRQFLNIVFKKSKDQELAKVANGLLITVYGEQNAIDWRFNKVKEPLPFEGIKMDGKAHEVGPTEDEFDTMALAKPLIKLRDEKYLPQFLSLLDYSFKVIEQQRDKKYWSYVNYLWRIAIAFADSLKEKRSFKPLLILEDWVSKNATSENSNWLKARLRELRNAYIEVIGKQNVK